MAERPFADGCWFLTGPTASGKTLVGISLAKIIGAQIVSLDSMAVYREMDVGVAKPSPDERRAAIHHLLDVVGPADDYTLARYLEDAGAAVKSIRSHGDLALFVGGTPLYLKGLLRGIFEGPAADWDFRRERQAAAAAHEPGWLHAELAAVDPAAAARLHPRDERRLLRALEVHAKTGRPMSDWQQQFDKPLEPPPPVFVLDWPRDALNERIDLRVDDMFACGLVDEVRSLVARFGELSRTASQAIGYRETIEFLARRRDLSATIDLVKIRTRQFAKRQRTWFRALSECRSIPVAPDEKPEAIARRIVAAWPA
jgi:tRNA dimethylallyltransferase